MDTVVDSGKTNGGGESERGNSCSPIVECHNGGGEESIGGVGGWKRGLAALATPNLNFWKGQKRAFSSHNFFQGTGDEWIERGESAGRMRRATFPRSPPLIPSQSTPKRKRTTPSRVLLAASIHGSSQGARNVPRTQWRTSVSSFAKASTRGSGCDQGGLPQARADIKRPGQ